MHFLNAFDLISTWPDTFWNYSKASAAVFDRFLSGNPPNVALLVMTIVINTIKDITFGAYSNLIKKIFKFCEPELNTSSSISGIVPIFRVYAPLLSRIKGVIFGCRTKPMRTSTLITPKDVAHGYMIHHVSVNRKAFL